MKLQLFRAARGSVVKWQRAGGLAAAVSLLVVLVACGDNKGSTGPTQTVPTPRLLQQGNWALDAPGDEHLHFVVATVTDPAAGRWEATVDWTFATNTVWMWVSNGACTAEQFALPECPFETACPCQFTIRSEVAAPKPRVLTIPNAPGGTRSLIIANLGPREESGTYNITLTSTSLVSDQDGAATGTREGRAGTLVTGVKAFRRGQ